MKCVCKKDHLRSAIALSEKMTGKYLALPVLGTTLLVVEGGTVTVRATNLDIGIEISIPATITDGGVVAVPGSVISSLLSNLQSEDVILELDDHKNLIITTPHTSARIKTHPHEDFPNLPTVAEKNSFSMNIDTFVSALRSVVYSASLSDIKPELSSVFLYTDGPVLICAATDSFRLAEKRVPLPDKEKDFSLLIPHKNIQELIRVFDGRSGVMKIFFDDNQAVFQTDGVYLTSRLVEGVFPDYKQIIPKEFGTEAVILKHDLLNAVKITNLFSDKFNKITITITPSKKLCAVSSFNADVGENKTTLDAAISGDDTQLNFNHKYITDCFQSITSDSVSLQVSGGRLLIIKNVGDPSFTYLLMPLNQ